MLYDCFSFFNELDVLEIRLNTLKDVVDRFVLVEASWTHTGHAKSYIFEENKERFRPFLDRIIHIKLTDDDLPPIPKGATERETAWIRENTQRNAIVNGLADAKPEDVLIIADLDEIPDPDIVKRIIPLTHGQRILNLELRNYAFYLNYLNIAYPWWRGGPQVLSVATFRNSETYAPSTFSEYAPRCANSIPSATLIRFLPRNYNVVKNAGWHFSSVGGISAIKQKLSSFAHTEFNSLCNNDEEIRKRLKEGIGLFSPGERLKAQPINAFQHPYLVANAAKYHHLILDVTEAEWRRSVFSRLFYRIRKSIYDWFIKLFITIIPVRFHPFFAALRKRLNLL